MIDIVFDHQDWLVANKPAGMNFHSEDGQAGFMVILEQQLGIKLWPVHRLDKLTSGLLLLAKSQQACAELSALFAHREVEKYYLAITSSKLKKKQGLIKGDMVKARRGAFKLAPTQQNPAVTQFYSVSLKPGYRLCLLKPKTGKTHQLRVAMKSQGSAIIGDTLYSGQTAKRLYLHSYALSFKWHETEYQVVSDGVFEPDYDLSPILQEHSWKTPWLLTWPNV